MRLGAFLPPGETGNDPVAMRDYAQAVEALGYTHLCVGDNMLSVPQYQETYYEPLVLLGYLAAVTRQLELVTDIVPLPMQQTIVVARQAAAVDVLSGGRLRLGIGLGWNDEAYEVLGVDWNTRGRRSEEQVAVLRALWTEELATFKGRWHTFSNVGLPLLPVQRPIPIWFGGDADPVLRRIARLGDGWLPEIPPDDNARQAVARLHTYARAAGRDPADIGIEPLLRTANKPETQWVTDATVWQELGATHLAVETWGAKLRFPDEHIAALNRCYAVLRAGV
ncbi:MAG: LLM class F420-dependent oxidoreductase [Chloroflexota bacterium]|nr:LLM class F420-dependent oxidoreductase [Chloroflexota bacterium]